LFQQVIDLLGAKTSGKFWLRFSGGSEKLLKLVPQSSAIKPQMMLIDVGDSKAVLAEREHSSKVMQSSRATPSGASLETPLGLYGQGSLFTVFSFTKYNLTGTSFAETLMYGSVHCACKS
jgi:hypothetical protein